MKLEKNPNDILVLFILNNIIHTFSRSSIFFSNVLLEAKVLATFASLLYLLNPLLSVRGYLLETSSSEAVVVLWK
jgi:hypothetical protein